MRVATSGQRRIGSTAIHAYGAALGRLISHGENTIFAVEGRPWVVRVHRSDMHGAATLHGELSMMRAFREAGFCVPEVIEARDGSMLQEVSGVRVSVIQRFRGRMLRKLGRKRSRILGETLAALHQTARSLNSEFDRPHWTRDAMFGFEAAWGSMESGGVDPGLAAALRADLHTRLADRNEAIPLHFDLHAGNIIWMGDTPGLIDWDDAGISDPIYDLVIPYRRVQQRQKLELLAGYGTPMDPEVMDAAAMAVASRMPGWLKTRLDVPGFVTLHAKCLERFTARTKTWLETH